MNNICVVIVTYNRKDLLFECVDSLLNQKYFGFDILIVDNNSNDGTSDLIKKIKCDRILYCNTGENLGGPGGFSIGVEKAYLKGYSYIILMDDDGRPADNECVGTLVDYANRLRVHNDLLMLNALVCTDAKRLSFGYPGINSVDEAERKAVDGLIMDEINPFNGTLLSRELVKEIGKPNKDFFYRMDEKDYNRRAAKAKAIIATVVAARQFHPKRNRTEKRVLGKMRYIEIEEPWKEYYKARNYTYMMKTDGGIKNRLSVFWRQFVTIVIVLEYGSNKCMCIKFIIKGFLDGINGRLGKTVSPMT